MLMMTGGEMVEPSIAYDRYAAVYDALLDENRINAYMRRQMLSAHRTAFHPGDKLLEIGCGTGDEALELARNGCEIIAVDPSEEMLNRAREKADRLPYGSRVTFLKGYAREVGELLSRSKEAFFDGAYSSFALSYEPDLGPVRDALRRFVRPGGILLLAIMNRTCAVEYAIATITIRLSIAGRRLSPSTRHKVGTVTTEVFARTVPEVHRVFSRAFKLIEIRAIPALIPPAYMNRVTRRAPSLLDMLMRIDPLFARLPLWRALGDHTLFSYRRRA